MPSCADGNIKSERIGYLGSHITLIVFLVKDIDKICKDCHTDCYFDYFNFIIKVMQEIVNLVIVL